MRRTVTALALATASVGAVSVGPAAQAVVQPSGPVTCDHSRPAPPRAVQRAIRATSRCSGVPSIPQIAVTMVQSCLQARQLDGAYLTVACSNTPKGRATVRMTALAPYAPGTYRTVESMVEAGQATEAITADTTFP